MTGRVPLDARARRGRADRDPARGRDPDAPGAARSRGWSDACSARSTARRARSATSRTTLDALPRGRLPLDRLVSHRLPLDEVGARVRADAKRRGSARRPRPRRTEGAAMNLDELDGRIGEGWGGTVAERRARQRRARASRQPDRRGGALDVRAPVSRPHAGALLRRRRRSSEYEPIWPPTLMMNKATATDDHHQTITWGAAQLGIGQGVLDAVADGLIEATGDLLVLVADLGRPPAPTTRRPCARRAASRCARRSACASRAAIPTAAARLVARARHAHEPVLRRQLMRITAVETRRYRVDFDPPFRAAWDPDPARSSGRDARRRPHGRGRLGLGER